MKHPACSLGSISAAFAIAITGSTLCGLNAAESYIGAGFRPTGEPSEYLNAPFEIFDLDIQTGRPSNQKSISIRGAASFTAMARSQEGTLYAIQDTRLVTVNEETGFATDVADLFIPEDPSNAAPFVIQSMVFGGSEPATLYVILATPDSRLIRSFEAEPRNASLATVNLTTGALTILDVALGGALESKHGIEYDPAFGLVHYYMDGGEFSYGPAIERINPETLEMSPVGPATFDDFNTSLPDQADGFVSLSEGSFLVLTSSFYMPEITMLHLVEFEGDIYYYTETGGSLPYMSRPVSSLELSADRSALVLEGNGDLIRFERDPETGEFLENGSVTTSISGKAVFIQSFATDPTTGELFALGYIPDDLFEYEGEYAIFKVTPGSGSSIEISPADTTYLDPESPYSYDGISSIAFDASGILYGISPNGSELVSIDLSSGEFSIPVSLDLEYSGRESGFSIAYSSRNDSFFLASHTYDGDSLVIQEISRSGELLAVDTYPFDLPLEGEYNRRVSSLIENPDGSFHLSIASQTYVYDSETDRYFQTTNTDFFILDASGELSSSIATLTDYFLTAVARFGESDAIPDVSVGLFSHKLTGDNRYSRTGRGQTVTLRSRKSSSLSGEFYANVGNDGSSSGEFTLRVSGGKRSDDISIILGARNLTAAFKTGFRDRFEPGQSDTFLVKFSRKRGTRLQERFEFSASADEETDTGAVNAKLSVPASSKRPTGLF